MYSLLILTKLNLCDIGFEWMKPRGLIIKSYFFFKERMNKADLIRFEKRTMYPNVLHELSE